LKEIQKGREHENEDLGSYRITSMKTENAGTGRRKYWNVLYEELAL
jgi:hypothetical protein